MAEENSTIGSGIGSIVDGAMKLAGLKEGALNGFSEHLGAVATVAIPTFFLTTRLYVKPALKKAGPQVFKTVSAIAPMGSIAFGKI